MALRCAPRVICVSKSAEPRRVCRGGRDKEAAAEEEEDEDDFVLRRVFEAPICAKKAGGALLGMAEAGAVVCRVEESVVAVEVEVVGTVVAVVVAVAASGTPAASAADPGTIATPLDCRLSIIAFRSASSRSKLSTRLI